MKNLKMTFAGTIAGLPFMLFAQTMKPFEINVKTNFDDNTKLYLVYYAFEDGAKKIDSALVKNKVAQFKGTTSGTSYAGLVCANDLYEMEAAARSNEKSSYFHFGYGKNNFELKKWGDLTLVAGDKLAQSMIGYQTKVKNSLAIFESPEYLAKVKEVEDMENEARRLRSALNEQYPQKQELRDKNSIEFIKQNPTSPFSVSLLEQLVAQRRNPNWEAINPLLDQVAPNFKDNYIIKYLESKRKGTEITEGKQYTDVTQPDANGKMRSLSELQGKYVLLDFWASWCGPCRAESPHLVKAYDKYKSKNFEIYAVSLDEDKDAWLAAVKKDGLNWIQVSDLQKRNMAAVAYGVTAIPTNYLIDPTGKIIGKNLRGEQLEQKLASIFGTN